MKLNKKFALLPIAAALVTFGSTASAAPYSFFNLTNNGNADISGQLSMDVFQDGTRAAFQFFNNVGTASSIVEIYFDDAPPGPGSTKLASIFSITDSDGAGTGVDFHSGGVNPSNLPGGNTATPSFAATTSLSAEPSNPQPARGVNLASEWVKITFDLQSGQSFSDVVTALNSGQLRVGLHMQSIGTIGGSDSYINVSAIPEPETYAMLLAGLGLMGFMARRRRETRFAV